MINRRRQLLIDFEQQRRFIMGAVLIAVILINLVLIITFLNDPMLLENIDMSDTMMLAGVEIIVVVWIYYFSLLISHKIAGPAFVLARDLKKISDGDLTVRTHLRKGDYYTEVGKCLCSTTETLYQKISRLKSIANSLAELGKTDKDVQQLAKNLTQELSYFNTSRAMSTAQSREETLSCEEADNHLEKQPN